MIHAVILAGGRGRRFWPQSRKNLPKQLLRIGRRYSPLEDLFNIIKLRLPKERIWVVANKEYLRSLRRQLRSLPLRNFLVEPAAKNTAAAIGLASLAIKKVDPQAVAWVLSSDQLFRRNLSFLKTLEEAARLAQKDDVLVTIGICPSRAAEEYGYLKIGERLKVKGKRLKVYKIERFVEKPSLKKARNYLSSKNYLWNSGIFVWRIDSILQSIKRFLPQLYAGLTRIDQSWGSPEYKRHLIREYNRFGDISIDYGVMEKARNIYTVVGNFSWQDLGSWNNLFQGFLAKDRDGNVIQGKHKGIDTCNSVVIGEHRHLVATVGVKDFIIVHTPSATLVCRKDKAQEVKRLTQILEKDKQLKKYL